MSIGKSILQIRKEKGLSQEKFGELFHVTRQTVSNWENEKSYPDLHTLVAISDLFEISLDTLLMLDKRKVAEEIIEHCRKNDFKNVIFSYDMAYPNKLEVSVYLSERNARKGKAVFSFVYEPEQGEVGEYNFIENPEKFRVEIKEN